MGIRISYTANNKYQDSPRAWYLHYQLKLREEVQSSALFFGSAIDDALNHLLLNRDLAGANEIFEKRWHKQEINGKLQDLRKTDKIRFYKSDLDIPENMITDDDKSAMEKYHPEWVTLRRKGLEMLKAYEVQVLPHIKDVLVVQEYVRIDNDDGDYIMGYVDLVAKWHLNNDVEHNFDPALAEFNDKVIIFDNKTSSQKYKPDSVKESGQLGTYTAHNSEKYVADAEGYIVIPKKFRKKKLPQIPIEIIIDQVAEDVIEHQFEEYEDTLKGIRLGNFPCTGCADNPFGCAYKKYCASGGKDTTGLVKVGKNAK